MFNRVDSSLVVKNQLPSFLRDDFPLLGEFLTQYYISQNYQGGPANLLENIDQYLNLDNLSNALVIDVLTSMVQRSPELIADIINLDVEDTKKLPITKLLEVLNAMLENEEGLLKNCWTLAGKMFNLQGIFQSMELMKEEEEKEVQ